MTPPPTATEEALQTALDDDAALSDVYVHMVRESDGHTLTLTKGSPNDRYISSSTVKPITCAAIAWGEHKGWLDLDDLAITHVPEFDALATSQQRNITIAHLMGFTSGLFTTVGVSSAADWAEYVDNCASLATAAGDPDLVPGTSHVYATDQHGLASVAAVNASPYADWDAYMTAFVADTGLFPGLTWSNAPGAIFGGNVQVNITAQEYAAFLRALFNQTALTPTLCTRLTTSDASPSNPTRETFYTWLVDGGMTGEDHHFSEGSIWMEQRQADWSGGDPVTRYATIGVGGQYAYHDTSLGVTFVISATFPSPAAQFIEGLRFARDVDALVTTWSAE